MIIELSTTFNDIEKKLLSDYSDVDIKLFLKSDMLSYCRDAEGNSFTVEDPKRMIGVGGLYLLELEDEPNEWWMGEWSKSGCYEFWGMYGDLDSALKGM